MKQSPSATMHSAPTPKTSAPRATDTPGGAAAKGNYAPSVPISVYRQLAAELEATRSQLDNLNQQNYQLTQQNQLLRHELERMVHNALRLQQVLYPDRSVVLPSQTQAEQIAAQIRSGQFSEASNETSHSPASTEPENPISDDSIGIEQLFTEQSVDASATGKRSASSRDVNGLWMIILILAIVITAFGAGFLAVPHLLQQFSGNENS
jgi:hypothetical protein